MSRYKPKQGEKLVGRRISPNTELGKELVKLRSLYAAAVPERTFNEMMKDRLNASLKVTLEDGIERDNRRRAVRKQLCDAIELAMGHYGQVPKTIGVPKHLIEEARDALMGSQYDGVKVVAET